MKAVEVVVRAIVHPCGRVLLHEVEQLAPGEKYEYLDYASGVPAEWYRDPACAHHRIRVTLPVPDLPSPRAVVIEVTKEVDKP